MIARIIIFFAVASVGMAELIPAARLIDWTPGTQTGVPGGIPTDRTMYVNALTGELGAGGTYGGTLAAGDGVTNDSTAINAMIAACPSGKYVYLPAATYRCNSPLSIAVAADDGITIRGDGESTIIAARGAHGIIIGQGANGFVVPSGASVSDMVVSGGLSKGSTTLTVGSSANLAEGQLIQLAQDIDESVPHVSIARFRYITKQAMRVITKPTSTTITVFPALYDDYGAGAIAVRIRGAASKANAVGVEDLLIDMDNSTGSNVGVLLSQAFGCWVSGVKVINCTNYPFSISNSLQSEIRHSFAAERKGGGSNGAGVLLNSSSGMLIEDNIVVENFPDMEINHGASGNLISRNFTTSAHFIDTNHGPNNQFNLYESNSVPGFKSDGYFGGERYVTLFNNKTRFATFYRFTRDATVVGNVFSGSTAATYQQGLPNMGNDSYAGTADYPSDPWRDWGMSGEIIALTMGTGSGYQVVGSHAINATAITVDTGTGTILAGDIVTFSGSTIRYKVVGFSGGVITIGTGSGQSVAGLRTIIADNATVTLSSDTGTLRFDSGQIYNVDSFGNYHFLYVNWNSFANSQRIRAVTVTGDEATFIADASAAPNATSLPPVGTLIELGGQHDSAYQELDYGVENTLIKKGNRYTTDGSLDSLGGDTLPQSLAYGSTKPQWLIDAETEHSATFNLRAFDPITPTAAGDSDIPAGYRYLFLVAPEQTSASINALGTELSIGTNKPLSVGAGGAASAILSGGLVCVFARTEGSSLVFTTPRTITEGESLTVGITSVTDGYEDVNGNDLPTFSGLAVSNASFQTTGVNHYGPDVEDMTGDVTYSDSGTTILQPAVVEVNGTASAVRFYIAENTGGPSVRVTVTDSAGNVLGSGTGTTTGSARWQSVAITSTPVTAGTTYMGTVQFLANGDPILRGLSGLASGSSYIHEVTPYGTALPAQFTPLTSRTTRRAIQIRVIPDAISVTATVTTLNASTLNIAP